VCNLSFPVELDIEKSSEIRLPLSNRLRHLTKDPNIKLQSFVDKLLENALPDENTEQLFALIHKRASAHSRRYGNMTLTADVLSAATLFAFRDGMFVDYPAVSTHIAAAAHHIERVIELNKWRPDDFVEDNGSLVSLEPSLIEKIDESFTSNVFSIVSFGAAAGAQISQQQTTAFHEAGHAVASFMLQPQIPITQVSIIMTQQYAGVMRTDVNSPDFDVPQSRKFLFAQLQVCLAGGIAERIRFGEDLCNSGAQSDLANASRLAWVWVAHYGLDDGFGPISLPVLAEQPGYVGGFLSDEAQRTVQQLLKACQAETRELLKANWQYVESLANSLLKQKTLGTREVIEAMIDKGIAAWPGTKKVRSKSVDREVRFADTAGVCQTLEGPVRFSAGDALVTGSQSEEWPIPRTKFDHTYQPSGKTELGSAGLYRKTPRDGIAIQLLAPRSIVLSNGRGVLQGQAGDWVIDYGEGDLSLVSRDLFSAYYDILA